MVIELFFIPLFLFISSLIGLLPQAPVATTKDISAFLDMLGTGLYFFGTDAFYFAIGSLIFWFSIDIGWGCVEWLYKKIPGVD